MKLIFRAHAIRRMYQRRISEHDVWEVAKAGTAVESYPKDTPYPSKLLLAWVGGRPLHVVVAMNLEDAEWIVVTAYQPDAKRWNADFTSRREQ